MHKSLHIITTSTFENYVINIMLALIKGQPLWHEKLSSF